MSGRSRKYIFIIIQLIMYSIFLSLDILGINISLSNRIKFAVVALCFLYVLLIKNKNSGKEHFYLLSALAFTVISDILILLTDYYFYGVLTFILAQQLYGMRITALYNREKAYPISLSGDIPLRIIYQVFFSFLVSVLLWLLGVNIDALLVVSVLYFICICTNVVRSLKLFIQYRSKRDIRYFAYGMVLFLLCDINVGLFNLSSFLPIGGEYETIYNVSSILMWTFYAPSQVLIALSGDNY